MKTTIRLAAFSLLAWCLGCSGATQDLHSEEEQVTISQVVASTSLEGTIPPGHFDQRATVSDVHVPALADCREAVSEAVSTWKRRHDLSELLHDQSPGFLQVHLTRASLDGYFEVLYRLERNREAASLRFVFINRRGAALDPYAMDFEVERFRDELTGALTCSGDE